MRNVCQAILLSMLLGTSCAVTANELSGRNISVELLDSPYVSMTDTWGVAHGDGAVTIYGRVIRNRSPFVGGGFVDVSVVGPEGGILESVRSNYIPRGSRKEREYFSRYKVTLQSLPEGSRVQLRYARQRNN